MNALEINTEGEINELDFKRLHEEDETTNLLHSCCSRNPSDKRLVILLTQVSISILILTFSATMLAFQNDEADKAIYMSLLSSTLSYWLGKNDSERK